MLELTSKYSIKEIDDLKDFITVTYVIIDDIYQRITPTHIKERKNINNSILSDSEIITISIVGKLLTIDSEKTWIGFCKKNLTDLFPRFSHRTRFNRTRRGLHAIIEEIRKEITSMLGLTDNCYRIIDSIPIPVCKFGRARFHKTFKVMARPMAIVLLRRKLTLDINYTCSLVLMVMLLILSLLQQILMTGGLYGNSLNPTILSLFFAIRVI